MNAVLLTLALLGQPDPTLFLSTPRTDGFFRTQTVTDAIGAQFHVADGTDLCRLNPDGTVEALVVGRQGDKIAVHDFCPLYDGSGVVYSHVYAGKQYCDLFRLTFADGSITKLTNAATEFDPPSGAAPWPITWEKRVFNHAPVCGRDGRIAFTSNRGGIKSPRSVTPANQLYVMDADGGNIVNITPMEFGGVAHPILGPDGRIYYSTGQEQGYRWGGGDGWGVWSINWDGSDWRPEFTIAGFKQNIGGSNPGNPLHFLAFSSDRTLFATEYYRTRVYGRLLGMPQFIPTIFSEPTQFGHPLPQNNIGPMEKGHPRHGPGFSYQRRGLFSPAEFAIPDDFQNNDSEGVPLGMLSHPFAIRGNQLGMTWTGANGDAHVDLGLYTQDARAPTTHPSQLTKLLDTPERHEYMGRTLAPWAEIYGSDVPFPQGPKSESLAPGEPFAEITTATLDIREIINRNMDPVLFYEFDTEDIEYVGVLVMEPTTTFKNGDGPFQWQVSRNEPTGGAGEDRFWNFEGFHSASNERIGRFADLVPVKKYRGPNGELHQGPNPPAGYTRIMGPGGKPDTSVRFYLPAEMVWSLQLLNAKKEAINGATAQTWHQGIAGEWKDCKGCHAHWRPATLDVKTTAVYDALFAPKRLRDVIFAEYYEDIKPIFDRVGFDPGTQPWKCAPLYQSSTTDVDDHPDMTVAEQELVRLWIDTALGTNSTWRDGSRITKAQRGGFWADSQRPSVSLYPTSESLLLGLYDRSGIKRVSLKSTASIAGRTPGSELSDLLTQAGDVWTLPHKPEGTLTIEVRDNQRLTNPAGQLISEDGNLTRLVRTFSDEFPPPPPDPPSELELLRAENADLKARLEDIKERATVPE